MWQYSNDSFSIFDNERGSSNRNEWMPLRLFSFLRRHSRFSFSRYSINLVMLFMERLAPLFPFVLFES